MLQLTANSTTLDIRNASFNLTLKSPLAGDNAGSYVFSVSLPYTERNVSVFGYPFRLTRKEVSAISRDGEIIYNGIHVQKGLWYVKSTTSLSVSIEMVIGSGHFNTIVDGKKLAEYFDTTVILSPNITGHFNDYVTKGYPDINHQFPSILNELFYEEGLNDDYSGIMNAYWDRFIGSIPNYTCAVPQLYLLFILKHLYEQVGYTATGSVFDDEYLKKALIFNNYALDNFTDISFSGNFLNSVVANPYLIKWDTEIIDPLAQYNITTGRYRITFIGNWKVTVNLSAKINTTGASQILGCYLDIYYGSARVVHELYETDTPEDYITIGYTHYLNIDYLNINKEVYIHIYYEGQFGSIYEAYIGDTGKISILNTTTPAINLFQDQINYKNHVPDIEVKTFLTHVFAPFKIMPFFDHVNKTVELVCLKDIIASNKSTPLENGLIKDSLRVYANDYGGLSFGFDFQGPDSYIDDANKTPQRIDGTIDTWADLPEEPAVSMCYFIKTLNTYYVYTLFEAETEEEEDTYDWVPYGDKFPDVTVDDGETPISSQLAPMLMRCYVDGGETNAYNMPAISAAGTSESLNQINEFPLRIMFYAGLKTGKLLSFVPETYNYPMASTVKYDSSCNTILPISYTWEDLIDRYYQSIIDWYKNRQKIEFQHIVSPYFISNLILKDKYFFQKTNILLSEVVVKITNKMFGPGKFKGWG